jgi:hypothetical protein
MSGAGYCLGEYSTDPYKIIIKKFKLIPYAKLGRVIVNNKQGIKCNEYF